MMNPEEEAALGTGGTEPMDIPGSNPDAVVPLGCDPGPNAIDISSNKDGKLWKEILFQPETDEIGSHSGMDVKVHYKGTLVDGTVFDESIGKAPFTFTVGEGAVIEGWDKGVVGMKRGEKIKLICHPDVAYKNRAQGSIPANSTLIFEIEMLDYSPADLTKKKTGQILRYNLKQGGSKYLTPNHGSLIEVLIRGKYNDTIVYPERREKFRLGEGCETGIPYGVEKALYKFRSEEASVIITKGQKFGIKADDYDKFQIPKDASLEFYVELLSFENTKEPWQLDGNEKVELSRQLKEVGNKFFSQANYKVAFKNYKLIIDHLKAEALLTGDEEEERKKLLLAAYLNMAICNLKLGKPTVVIRNCDDALDLDHSNTKALFRRGQAYLEVNMPEKAKLDFEKVTELDPSNSAVASQLSLCEKKLKENLKDEKKLYTKMFSKTVCT